MQGRFGIICYLGRRIRGDGFLNWAVNDGKSTGEAERTLKRFPIMLWKQGMNELINHLENGSLLSRRLMARRSVVWSSDQLSWSGPRIGKLPILGRLSHERRKLRSYDLGALRFERKTACWRWSSKVCLIRVVSRRWQGWNRGDEEKRRWFEDQTG